MRLNAKVCKELRHTVQYFNQSATPGTMPFPGVARMYSHPVYTRREKVFTTYEKKDGRMVRVLHKRIAMNVLGRKGREQFIPLMMEQFTDEKTGQQRFKPKLDLVAVTKPARLADCAKANYRRLKRMARSGMLRDPHAFDALVNETLKGVA